MWSFHGRPLCQGTEGASGQQFLIVGAEGGLQLPASEKLIPPTVMEMWKCIFPQSSLQMKTRPLLTLGLQPVESLAGDTCGDGSCYKGEAHGPITAADGYRCTRDRGRGFPSPVSLSPPSEAAISAYSLIEEEGA